MQLGKEKSPPTSEEPLFLRLRREVNRVVHSQMTTPDIAAEIVRRALDTCCTVPQRKERTLRLSAEILALVAQEQRFLPRRRGAQRLCERDQLFWEYMSQAAVVKGGCACVQAEETGGSWW